MVRLADRMHDIQPFHVMDILARARAMEAAGRDVIHMEIGEPDFATAPAIISAGVAALKGGKTQYTPALGLLALRAAIAASYPESARVEAGRVVVTPGASGALQLVLGSIVNPGDAVLMADPGYPCNRHFVRLFEGHAISVPVGADSRFQLTAELVAEHWSERTAAVLVASPSNPTGTLISETEMAAIHRVVRERGAVLIVDEIYHGLTYDAPASSALALGDDVFVINSFSKYYGMTGWRVGWLVAPAEYIDPIERLAQNIFIAAATPAQYAALKALDADVTVELKSRRDIFRARRDYLLPALRELGFDIPVTPEGAFYLYADCSAFTDDSHAFAQDVLEQTGVAITPGLDFGVNEPERFVRFSYAADIARLEEAVGRLSEYLDARKR